MSERTPEQKAAIESDAKDILVEAGAGSGKTSTSVDRYERLIGGSGATPSEVDPSKVLVFTFTEKAATELRERIRERRDEGEITFSMSSLWVGTFHSICARMLRAHPIAANVDPSFAVLDDVRADRLKRAAYDEALARTLADRELTQKLAGHYRDPDDDTAGRLLARFKSKPLREGIQTAYERLRAIGQVRPGLPAPPRHRNPFEIHTDMKSAAQAALRVPGLRQPTKDKIDDLIGWLESISPEELTYPGLMDQGFSSSSKKISNLIETVNRIKAELAAIDFGDATWLVLGALLGHYADAYSDAKHSRGALDYEDLQLKTLDMLRSHRAIADSYRNQFLEIMVDEFQDTNQLQMELIEELRGEETRLFTVGDEMQSIYSFRFADVRLFRNRREGAESGVEVLPLSANFRSQSEVIGAVNHVGSMFEALIEGIRTSDEPGGGTGGTSHRFARLRVGLPALEGFEPGVELLLVERNKWREKDLSPLSPLPKSDGDGFVEGKDSEGQHEAEALALAQRVREAIEEEGVPPGEIVILFRSRTRMWIFEEALKHVGLRPYVVGGTRFWETREGVDLRSLLGVIANPLDDDSLIGSLAGAVCGLGAEALWLLSRREKGETIWSRLQDFAADPPGEDSDKDRAAGFVATIERLRSEAPGTTLGRLVESAINETGYDLVNLRRDPSGAGLANIRHVIGIADEFEKTEGRDLRGLIDWIDASAELDAEEAVATADEHSDVVRLMTIHKSKGLEFDMVCVADLGKRQRTESETVLWVSPGLDRERIEFGLRLPEANDENLDLYGWPILQKEANLDATDEELRILHVAMTRARRKLVLSGVIDLESVPDPSETGSMADRLAQSFGIDRTGPDEIPVPAPEPREGLAAPEPGVIKVRRILDSDAGELVRGQNSESSSGAAGDSLPPLWRPPVASYPEVPLSYSALAEYRECPARFFARRILRMEDPEPEPPARSAGTGSAEPRDIPLDLIEPFGPLDPETAGLKRADASRFGNAVHTLLERMPERRWLLPTDAEIAKALEKEGLPGDGRESRIAKSMVEGFTRSELGGILGRESVEVETGLLVEIDGVMVRGFADLLARNMDPPLILDYKSNQLEGTSIEEVMKKYELQRDLYALAVRQALGVELVETAFVFLRDPDHPVRDTFDEVRLAEASARIRDLVGDIAAGRYLGGPDAGSQPCSDCWACDLLGGQIDAVKAA